MTVGYSGICISMNLSNVIAGIRMRSPKNVKLCIYFQFLIDYQRTRKQGGAPCGMPYGLALIVNAEYLIANIE